MRSRFEAKAGLAVGWRPVLGPLRSLLLAGLALAVAPGAKAFELVQVPSLDAPNGQVVQMPGFWFRAARSPAPAMVLLHGCGGPYGNSGKLAQRMQEYARLLNGLGVHVLVTDSLSPRGERELCTQRVGTRAVTQEHRRRDALGALKWLAGQAAVDASRLGLLGWSNGGSTVLASTNHRHPEVRTAAVRPALAVAFYPGCETELKRGHEPTAPTLLLLGADDDWTPAAPCEALVATQPERMKAIAYPGAVHGFDGTSPVRLRKDVPNGTQPGQGVHVGAHPASREAAVLALQQFIQQQWP